MTPILLSLSLLLACTDKADDTAGSVLDTGDPGTGDNSPCGPWTGFWQVGAEWQWLLDPAYSKANQTTGGWSAKVLDTEVYKGILVWRVQEELDFDVEGYETWEDQVEYRYVCDDGGLQLLQMEGVYNHDRGSTEESGWWEAKFDDPQQVVPVDMAPGDTWGFTSSYDYAHSGGTTRQSTTVSFNAIAQTTVTVGAGTFDVMEVDVSWSQDPRMNFEGWSRTVYYAQGVGEVQYVDYAQLDWFDGNPEFTVE